LEKLDRLIEQAKSILVESSNPGRLPLWRAYVALEYAILDLKLRYGLEGNPPPKPVKSPDLTTVKSMISRLDLSSGSAFMQGYCKGAGSKQAKMTCGL
jgi:hypothetical protein